MENIFKKLNHITIRSSGFYSDLPTPMSAKKLYLTSGKNPKYLFVYKDYIAYRSWRRQSNPLQYSCLENPMDGRTWWAEVHGVTKSRTPLSDFPFTFHFQALEKEMATHSSVLALWIPGTGEPGGLPSMGSHRVRHDWGNLAAAAACMHQ